MFGSPFSGRNPAYYIGSILDHLARVKRTFRTRKTLQAFVRLQKRGERDFAAAAGRAFGVEGL